MSKILVIDDSEVARNDLYKILSKENHEVLQASNGLEAIEIIKKEVSNLDIILSDINMPEMDGLTMCEKLKEFSFPDLPPILMTTTETSSSMRERAKKLGVSGWVFKPIDTKALLKSVSTLIERHSKNKSEKK